MLSALIDHRLSRYAASRAAHATPGGLPTRDVTTPVGVVRVYDSASDQPCVVLVPDGPNVIEHLEPVIALLSPTLRVVCFDMPGFGRSLPAAHYAHSLDQGAHAVLGVLDALGIEKATLAFSCANGFYALRAAQIAPQRIRNLVLSQTPSLAAMHAWTQRIIPWPLRIPVLGQLIAWLFRRKSAHGWYLTALPRTTDATPFQAKARTALANGGCFCLAGVVQGLGREAQTALNGATTPMTMIWGAKDHSHKYTDHQSILTSAPSADIVHFDDCGHFPDIEQPERFAALLTDRVSRYLS
ncbi:MAG: alpha/beta hydrolase [Tahibacter sp.]